MNTNELAIFGAKAKIKSLLDTKRDADREIKELKKFLKTLKGGLVVKIKKRSLSAAARKAISIRMKAHHAALRNGAK
jgi:hypothetical protein